MGRRSSTRNTRADASRLSQFRAVLAIPRCRRLFLSQLLSQAGDGLYQVALASVLIFDVSAARTPSQVTKVFAVTLLPFSIVGPFTGPFIDRVSRRSIRVGASFVRFALTLLMILALGWTEGSLLFLAVATISVNRFFHSTKSAVLPGLVPSDAYLAANTLSSTIGMVFGLAGAVIGGPLTDATSPKVSLIAAATCMAAAAAVAATIVLPRGEKQGLAGILSELGDDLRDVREGLRVLLSRRLATYGVSSVWAMRALLGFVLLAALVLLRSRFDVRATGFSGILAGVGVGGFAGALLVPVAASRFGQRSVAPIAFVVAGIAALLVGPIPTWPTILATVFIAGAAMSCTKIASDTLIQSAIPDRYRGRAFTVYDIGYNGAFVVAALIPTLIISAVGELGIIALTGLLSLAGGLALAMWKRRLPEPIDVRSYSGARGDEVPREVVWDGVSVEVAEVEGSWQEERKGVRLLRFRLRLADGRRVEVSRGEEWHLDRILRS
ncbi:MAG TPA: MFS transporter [Actinomycetota bacterium]|nr:MFS transporter [Actinomycetota bacterium]